MQHGCSGWGGPPENRPPPAWAHVPPSRYHQRGALTCTSTELLGCAAMEQWPEYWKKKMERSGRGEEILRRRDWEGKQRILTKQPVFCHICKLFIYWTASNCWQLPRTGVVLKPSRYKWLTVSKAEAGVCGGATGLYTYTCISIYVFCLSIIKWFRGKQEQGSQ